MSKIDELKQLEKKWKEGKVKYIKNYDIKGKMKILSFVFDGKFSGVETEYGFIGMWNIKMGDDNK